MSTSNHEPLCVGATEAARLLGCSRNAVYELIKAGRLPVVKLTMTGTRKYIPREAIVNFIKQSLQESHS